MVAQCLRFAPEYVYLKKLVASGRYGAVTAASFTRLTPPPCAPLAEICASIALVDAERTSARTGRRIVIR